MTSSNQMSFDPDGESLEEYVASLLAAVEKGMAETLLPYDLISLEFKLLKHCLRNEECTATQLAKVLPTDPARISRLVNGLVEKGFLFRRRLRNDRRIVMLSLTDAGRDRLLESDRAIQEFFNLLTAGITEEARVAFVSIAVAMTTRYEIMRREK
ncbi:MAG: MarR family transcriptional regulator [Chloroflexota bacterium]|nr:MarR family transcriptional regulator [Chloroflexota bacterium]